MTPGLSRDEWVEKLDQLGAKLEELGVSAHIVAIGSVPAMLLGQPGRTSLDLDVWKPSSAFHEAALREAAEAVGLLFDPKDFVEPDMPYLQIVRPGIVQVGPFEPEAVDQFSSLKISRPPVENILASKLCRASEKDIEDIFWLAGQFQPDISKVREIVQTFPKQQRQTALENMVFLEAFSPTPIQSATSPTMAKLQEVTPVHPRDHHDVQTP